MVKYNLIQDLHCSHNELFNFMTVSATSGILQTGTTQKILFAATTQNSVFTLTISKENEIFEENFIPLGGFNPTDISFSKDYMAVGSTSGEIDLFDPLLVKTGILKLNPSGSISYKKTPVDFVRFIPNTNDVFVIFSDSSAHCYSLNMSRDLAIGSPNSIITQLRQIENLIYDEKDKIISHSLISNSTVQYEIHSDKELSKCYAVAYTDYEISPKTIWKFFGKIQQIKFSPAKSSQNLFALACKDPYLRVFSYSTRKLYYIHRSYYGNILCFDFSPDGKLLAAGGQDDTISVYDIQNNCVLCRCTGHRSFISSVKFDSTYDEQLNGVKIENTLNIKEAEKGLEEIKLNYKNLNDADLLAAVRKLHSNENSGNNSRTENTRKTYRLISSGHDCMLSIWNIDVNRAKIYQDYHIVKARNRLSTLSNMGEDRKIIDQIQIKNPFDSENNSPNICDYPSLYNVLEIEPLIRERVHGYPIVKMESCQSNIFTISQSGNFRLFKPSVTLCKTLIDEENLDEEIEEENPQLDIKLSNFRTKFALDSAFSFIRSTTSGGKSPSK